MQREPGSIENQRHRGGVGKGQGFRQTVTPVRPGGCPFGKGRVLAHEPQRKGAAAARAGIAARAVERAEMEGDRIARLHRPFADRHALGLGVGHGHVVAREEGLVADPAGGHHVPFPQVRSRNAAKPRIGHRVKRHPEADAVAAVDKVIGPVRMPGRRHRGAGFLDQNVVVEHLHPVAAHQGRGSLRDGGVPDHAAEFRDTLPVAVIVEEETRLARLLVAAGIVSGFGHVADDPCTQRIDMGGEQAGDHRHAFVAEGGDLRCSDGQERVLRSRITTSTDAISAPCGALGSCEITSWSEGASDRRPSSSQ